MLGGVICTVRGGGAATFGAGVGLSDTWAVIAVVGPVKAGRSISGGGTTGGGMSVGGGGGGSFRSSGGGGGGGRSMMPTSCTSCMASRASPLTSAR